MENIERSKAERFIIVGYGLSITAILLVVVYGFIFSNGLFRKIRKKRDYNSNKNGS